MPDSSAWALPIGGKFAGMRTIVVCTPCCSSTSQKERPKRPRRSAPADNGRIQSPIWTLRPGGPSCQWGNQPSKRRIRPGGWGSDVAV